MDLKSLSSDLEAIEKCIASEEYKENAEVIRDYILNDIASIDGGIEWIIRETQLELINLERRLEKLNSIRLSKQNKIIILKKYIGEW